MKWDPRAIVVIILTIGVVAPILAIAITQKTAEAPAYAYEAVQAVVMGLIAIIAGYVAGSRNDK